MPAVAADLCLEARWTLPMTSRGRVLENHALVVRDGRILDLLPNADAAQRYAAGTVVRRPAHLLMPGLVNAHTRAASSPLRDSRAPVAHLEAHVAGPEMVRDGALVAIAEMLMSGITCFADRCRFPDEAARTAAEQGMRAVVGLPVAETPSPWAMNAAAYLTEGLRVRDEFADHPLISTVFAPHAADTLSDATFGRLAMLADELDAGVMIDLHASTEEIARSLAAHGARPIERLQHLGLLTPALNAVHMTHSTAADIELAQRTGIAVSLGLQACLGREQTLPPVAALRAAGIRLGLGTGDSPCRNQDLWAELKLSALMSRPHAGESGGAWDALAMATRGGAAVLGLESEIGTLEAGKWADACCVDLSRPATQPLNDPVSQLVFCGGRDLVRDVWVAGRHLLSEGEFMRLDWSRAAAHADAWPSRVNAQGEARG